MTENRTAIAIIGSGPSGCYTAQFLRRKWPDAEITIFESLPAPYGLLRYGVATDHQGTKAVAAQFDRLFEREGVRFAGNVTVGTDLSYDELTSQFDVVVRATGLKHDRPLAIESEADCPVIGAGAILKAVNGHPLVDLPTSQGKLRSLGRRLAVIGNGNVAMDVVRILCKPSTDFAGSDVDDLRLEQLRADGIMTIDIFGRSPISQAKFDLSMLKEVLVLPGVRIGFTGVGECDCKAAAMLQEFGRPLADAQDDKAAEVVAVNFHFGACPEDIQSSSIDHVLKVKQSGLEASIEFSIDTVITATGFTNHAAEEPELEGCRANVFKVGWLNRDGKGTIAANRKDAKEVAERIVALVESGELSSGAPGFTALEKKIGSKMISFEEWKNVDAHERSSAPSTRCRKKVTDVAQMIDIARRSVAAAAVA